MSNAQMNPAFMSDLAVAARLRLAERFLGELLPDFDSSSSFHSNVAGVLKLIREERDRIARRWI